jgi:hypothetical protein
MSAFFFVGNFINVDEQHSQCCYLTCCFADGFEKLNVHFLISVLKFFCELAVADSVGLVPIDVVEDRSVERMVDGNFAKAPSLELYKRLAL